MQFAKKIKLSICTTLTAGVLLTSTAVGTPVSVNAAESQELSTAEQQELNAILEHLEFSKEDNQITIVNEEELKNDLNDSDAYNQLEGSVEQLNNILKYVKFDQDKNQVIIENKEGVKDNLDSPSYNQLTATVEQFNEIIDSPEGKELKEQIFKELGASKTSSGTVSIQGISGCGAASIAGFAHTAAFSGLMTVAGVSGPAGWTIGTGVGAVWLGASAAAGCLS
ncbi:hypothetical protein [Priestia megaterium]|uniref:hypothetical protein n=1 Tax=Priestia megaterium TaxID=1404 RepID=UPI0035A85894